MERKKRIHVHVSHVHWTRNGTRSVHVYTHILKVARRGVCMCMYVCVYVCLGVRAYVYAGVCVCVRIRFVHTHSHVEFIAYTHAHPTHGRGWRRRIGCLKLQVSFRKRATNFRSLLRNITCKDKTFYASSSVCHSHTRTPTCTRAWLGDLHIHTQIHTCINKHLLTHKYRPKERWGAGVETHFQEISWNLRPVVNGT